MDSIIGDAIDEAGTKDMRDESARVDGTADISRSGAMTDDELKAVLKDLQTNITVVGCGDTDGNTTNRMHREGVKEAKPVAANTDVQRLIEIGTGTKILMGEQKTQGHGAGSLPQVDEETALESQEKIYGAIEDSDMVFVTAELGGGTGTGPAPVVTKTTRESSAFTIAIVTIPFTTKGKMRRANAETGFEWPRDVSDTVIVVPSDRLFGAVGKLPVQQAFKVSDGALMRSVKGITELITRPGLVNLDFTGVGTVMKRSGVTTIGLGESDSESKAQESVKSALHSPLLDVDIFGANSALVNVTGGSDMGIEEAEGVVEEIYDHTDPDTHIIQGTSVDDELEGMMRTMIIATGVESSQIYGRNDEAQAHAEERLEGIDYVE